MSNVKRLSKSEWNKLVAISEFTIGSTMYYKNGKFYIKHEGKTYGRKKER